MKLVQKIKDNKNTKGERDCEERKRAEKKGKT